MELITKIEAVLFAIGRPISIADLSKNFGVEKSKIKDALIELKGRYSAQSGIYIIEINGKVQFVTNPECAGVIRELIKDEVSGPLTRPQLEALTIIAYCAPITKYAVEQIRGVNCTLVLRNLMIRGMIEHAEGQGEEIKYTVTHDLIRHLGIQTLQELPQYERLHNHESVAAMMRYGNETK